MKKRIFTFAAALLILLSFSVPVCAFTALPAKVFVEEVYPTEPTPVANIASKTADFLSTVQELWRQYGLIFIVVLVILCVIIAVTISEKEQEKKRQTERDKQPRKKHEK